MGVRKGASMKYFYEESGHPLIAHMTEHEGWELMPTCEAKQVKLFAKNKVYVNFLTVIHLK